MDAPQHTCDENGPWGCDHPDCAEEAYRQQQGEIDAENAWLRAAEAPTAEDYAFEQYEARMGLLQPEDFAMMCPNGCDRELTESDGHVFDGLDENT